MDKLGPYELNQIFCGECAAMMESLPDGCIDLTVTSPPYDNLRTYNGYTFDFEPIAKQLYRVTKPRGVVVWVVGDETKDGSESLTSFRQALNFRELGFNVETMIYNKNSFRYPFPDKYHQVFEYMFVLSKGTPKTINLINDRRVEWKDTHKTHLKRESNGSFTRRNGYGSKEYGKRYNIWQYSIGGGHCATDNIAHDHPAIFPEALARDHIISWSNPGDLVFDPMAGSGTTAKQAKELGRLWLGFDISQEYVDLANRRVAMARIPLFVETEQPVIVLAKQAPLFSEMERVE